jgi:cysteine desulfurase
VIYLDHAASAPMHPDAVEAMREWMAGAFGNPSGSHSVARRAKAAIEDAREVVADFLGVEPAGVVFTSGGTEADNLAVGGTLAAQPTGPSAGGPAPIVVSAVEHPAVAEAARAAQAQGHEVRVLGVGEDGVVDMDQLRRLVDPEVRLVSVQTANNETGVIQPIEGIAHRVRRWAPSAVFHTDAVQAAAWCDLSSVTSGADLVAISGHKFGGPQGVGALGIRHGARVAPILHGGGQEQERRSGTHNVAGVIGLAAAIRVLQTGPPAGPAVEQRRDRLIALVQGAVPTAIVSAPDTAKLPGHCHLRFPGVESEALLFLLDERGVCASAGAACASGALEGSPALLAMGVDKEEASSVLRLTLGPATTDDDVTAAAAAVAEAVALLRVG